MSQAVSEFLGKGSLAPHDLIAKRAIRAYARLTEMQRNAYDRGHGAGFIECQRGIDAALYAFASVNTAEDYPFADEVDPKMSDLTNYVLDIYDPPKWAQGLLDQAEGVVHALSHVLTPVCTISGTDAVRILRGEHVTVALRGVVIANDH